MVMFAATNYGLLYTVLLGLLTVATIQTTKDLKDHINPGGFVYGREESKFHMFASVGTGGNGTESTIRWATSSAESSTKTCTREAFAVRENRRRKPAGAGASVGKIRDLLALQAVSRTRPHQSIIAALRMHTIVAWAGFPLRLRIR